MQGVFVASIFLSAFLLFLVQPLITKLLLPTFGGSPAVWNTALVFFQTALLGGYLYADVLVRRAGMIRRRWIHGVVVLAPLILLPPALPDAITPSSSAWPAGTLLLTLALVIGAPFFVLATNSSLVQHWWSRTGLEGSEDPYWLYAASNIGSLLALLAYPFVVEPAVRLSVQLSLWSAGYGLFAALTLLNLWFVSRRSSDGPVDSEGRTEAARLPAGRVLLWVARAAVGSSILLSVSMRITTDVAAVPLFWVVPLAIYMFTFIVAFAFAERLPRAPLVTGSLLGAAASFGLLLTPRDLDPLTVAAVALATLFFGALLCHRDLAADRPEIRHLTSFYLWIAVGGAVGGALNSLVAPVVFDSVAEFPITLAALVLLIYAEPGRGRSALRWRPGPVLGIACAAAAVAPELVTRGVAGEASAAPVAVIGTIAMIAGLAMSRYVALPAGIAVATTIVYLLAVNTSEFVVTQERSFFGVSAVHMRGDVLQMVHGTTMHGSQSTDPRLAGVASSYYHREGPLGSVIAAADSSARIGLIGLGAGTLSVLGKQGQQMTYFEIDPLVQRLAEEHFSYLARSAASTRVVLGDGRLKLAEVPDGSFDIIVADAFSSDFVPAHLLTVEALGIYLNKVTPDGVVLLHLSNRYADLRRILKGFSEVTGLPVAISDYEPSEAAAAQGATRTRSAAIAKNPEVIRSLLEQPLWSTIPEEVPTVTWTDQRTDLLSVLR